MKGLVFALFLWVACGKILSFGDGTAFGPFDFDWDGGSPTVSAQGFIFSSFSNGGLGKLSLTYSTNDITASWNANFFANPFPGYVVTGLQAVLTTTPHGLAAVYSHPFTACTTSSFCSGVSQPAGQSLIINYYSWTGTTFNRQSGYPSPVNQSVATTTTFNWSVTPTTFPGRLGVDGTGAIFFTDQFNGNYWQKLTNILKNTCEKVPLGIPCDPSWATSSCNTAGCATPGMSAIAVSPTYVFIGFADRSSANLWRLNLGTNPPYAQVLAPGGGAAVTFPIADLVYKASTNELWALGFQNNRVVRLGTTDDWATATVLSDNDWTTSVPSGLQLTAIAAGQDQGPQSLQFNFVWALAAPGTYASLNSFTGNFAILNVEGIFPVCMDPTGTRLCFQVVSWGRPGGSSSG
jgi:hypothetical protein